ncbi:MAG TPA: glycosyltransferase [Thermoanaerobaculia bacterium]|nr:glycosyltransferase [Thermoanaerobaculia bacterium]
MLAVAELWQGSDGHGFVQGFRRFGHSVRVVPAEAYFPAYWRSRPLRLVRRLLEHWFVRELAQAISLEASHLRPHLFFAFKGRVIPPGAISDLRQSGVICTCFYPDVSFRAHGRYLPRTLPFYDHVFTAKSFGVRDLAEAGVANATFLPHGFDPAVHFPIQPSAEERERYESDVCFIGTWSPKKERILTELISRFPHLKLAIWGDQWSNRGKILEPFVRGQPVFGLEYTKVLACSRIALGLLSEIRTGASSGDRTTSRTFQIPATGTLMLHERTDELLQFFREGEECACFADGDELAQKVQHFLGNDEERMRIAAQGRARSLASDYSTDARVRVILQTLGLAASSLR